MTSQAHPPFFNGLALFLLVFVLALAVRAIFVCEWHGLPYGLEPILDAQSYDDWAKNIAAGHLLRAKAFYQSPLFPYLLGGLYRLVGQDILITGLFNALLGAAACGFIAFSTLRLFGAPAALITGLLAASYQPMIFYTAPVMKEPLELFLLSVFVVFALRALETKHIRDFCLVGLFIGLSVLVRGNALFLLPAFWLLAWLRHRKQSLKGIGFSLLLCLLCIIPATVHNYVVSDDFVPLNYADGFNLFVGNSPIATGTDAYPADISTNPTQEEIQTTWIARARTASNLKPSGVSRFWRAQALDFVVSHPFGELLLLGRKFIAFWSNTEVFDDYNIDFIRANFPSILNFDMPWFGLISCCAAFAAAVLWRDKRSSGGVLTLAVFTLAYLASLMPFYITDRYRLPVAVFLLPLAGAALPCLVQRLRVRDWSGLGLGFLALTCGLVLAAQPVDTGALSPPAYNWGLITTLYADAHRDADAVGALHKALALSPQEAGFVPIDRGAEAEQNLGNSDEAERLTVLATQIAPKESGAWYYLALMKIHNGDLPGALKTLQKAIETGPSFTINYTTMAQIYLMQGNKAQAIEAMKQAAAIDPTDASIAENLAKLQQP